MKLNKTGDDKESNVDNTMREEFTHHPLRGNPGPQKSRRRRIIIIGIIFLTALGVRLLSWHDTRLEAGKVQSSVAGDYRRIAQLLLQGGITSFLSPTSPLSDPNTLGHPPGYSILLAFVFSLFGESDTAIQFVQIIADAAAAVVIFLIVAELLPLSVAIIAGLLVALSPQFAWNSVLLLPDSLAVLPILLAVYCITRASKRPRWTTMMTAGAFIGLSCWLRANAMLLAPFLVAVVPVLFERGKRLRYAAALMGGALLIIVPLTIRNAIVFRHFIPLSLGAGQTLLEGIADYDKEGRFGLPDTDLGIMKMEAELYNRPDYYGTLFSPDGIKRERLRLARGFAVIRSHPLWFFGVMVRRAASMLRLERARLISAEPPVAHPLNLADAMQPVWSSSPAELIARGTTVSPQAEISLAPDGQLLYLTGDNSAYGRQFISAPITIQQNTDYVLKLAVRIEQGRMSISVVSVDSSIPYASTIIETMEGKTPEEQPLKMVQMPFVSGRAGDVQVILSNEASKPARPVVRVGAVELFNLGPASYVWTRYPRLLVRSLQKLFLTAFMLPLALIGIALLVHARRGRALAILLVVPAYYLCVQSAMHTEYRYVLAVHYFLFVMVAVTLSWAGGALWRRLRKV